MISVCVTFSADPFSSAIPSSVRYLGIIDNMKHNQVTPHFTSHAIYQHDVDALNISGDKVPANLTFGLH